jgi:polyvinyl alcohol dehydrogenase (cytochrome)
VYALGHRVIVGPHRWQRATSECHMSCFSRGVRLALGVVMIAAWPALAVAQSESAGVAQYFANCASCHESNEPGHQAPKTAVLKQMTPERILEVLTTGSMRTAAAAVSDADKRLIAEWVGGRKIDAELVGAGEKMPNVCSSHPAVRESDAPAWNGWGNDLRNTRSQSAKGAGLTPGQVSRLQLKWAFGFPGATALYSQTAYDGRLYVSSNAGYVYSLDAATGCIHWSFRAQSAVRSGFFIGRLNRNTPRLAAFFGDIRGTAYALDASTGEVIWKTLTDPHPLARITGTPVLHDGRLYVPVTSLEEPESGQADYTCCTFRGSMVALDATTGKSVWKTYTITEEPKVVGRNSRNKDMMAPAGAGVWVTPTLVLKRRAVYITTGNAFSGTPSNANAVMAFHMDTGKVLWSMQALALDTWHNGCVQNIPGRAAGPGRGGAGRGAGPAGPGAGGAAAAPAAGGAAGRTGGPGGPPPGFGGGRGPSGPPYPPENCPAILGPDWDFAAPAALATTSDGRDVIVAAQKQGLVWGVNPDNGQVIWKQDVAREIAGGRGETLFGGALDSQHAYFGLISSAHLALDLKTGEEVWYVPVASPEGRQNQRGIVGAVSLIPGVVLSGARDGMIRAASSRTGQLLWEFDSAKEFTTVNGVAARGGSAASGGPTVANGMVFIGSGYPGFQGGQPGNVLLAFAPAVRLDQHANEMRDKAAAGTAPAR